MLRIIFTRNRFDLGADGHGERGFIFDPTELTSKERKSFVFLGYRIWSPSWYIFISTDQNLFFILETLLHEIVHLVIFVIFFRSWISKKANWWYDWLYNKLLRALSKI